MIEETVIEQSYHVNKAIIDCLILEGVEPATPEWIEVAKHAYACSMERKKYEEMERKLLDKLKKLQKTPIATGGGFIYECSTRSGSIDYGSIPELRSVNLEVYRKKDVEMWKLRRV